MFSSDSEEIEQLDELLPGYRIEERIGTGAGSAIFRAFDESERRWCAVKRVVRHRKIDGRFVEQAENEFTVSQALKHPVLRECYSLSRIRGLVRIREVLIVMEYCPGTELSKVGPLPMAGLLRLFDQLASGLQAMHRSGFIHTDMKPNNVIIDENMRVKIIDFGQSCRIGEIKARVQGTPDFIAPEQVQRHRLDARTDVFNLGATLYWCLTGQPIPTDIPQKKKEKNRINLVGELAITPPHELSPRVPEPLSKLVCDCCRRDPRNRPTMADVIGRLQILSESIQFRKEHAPAAPATCTR